MAIVVSVSCDTCGETVEENAGIDDGVNVIEVQAENWELSGDEDFCPKCK